MSSRNWNWRLFFHFAMAIFVLGGCAPPIKKPVRVCPGKESATEALYTLRLRAQNMKPLKASGQCLLEYYGEEKKHKENFPTKLWVNPPVEIYMQGDVAFNPRGLVLGSNKREFWLSIRPKEISTYWWGKWAEQGSFQDLPLSPKLLLEVLGIAAVGGEEEANNWSLSKKGAFDILTKRNGKGRIIKKIHLHSCTYFVWKIEYFDADGEAVAVAELYRYQEITPGFPVPTVIRIVKSADGNKKDSIKITLGSVKSTKFTKKQQDRFFKRPVPKGFKRILANVGGEWIEQSQ